MKRIYKIALLLVLGGGTFSCQNQETTNDTALVIAHRGASHYAPENTVAAAMLAWEQNADAVELDIHLSSDKKIVVMHDHTTKRTSGKDFLIKDTPLDSLKTLDVGSFKDEKYAGEPIPVLDELVETLPEGKTLWIEIKAGEGIVPILKNEFGDHPKVDQFVFIDFDYERIKEAKQAFPNNKAFWLSSKIEEDLHVMLQRVKDDNLDGIDFRYNIITQELVDIAHELNLEVHAWTVDDFEKGKELAEMGVKGITTNIPDKMLETLSSRDN